MDPFFSCFESQALLAVAHERLSTTSPGTTGYSTHTLWFNVYTKPPRGSSVPYNVCDNHMTFTGKGE